MRLDEYRSSDDERSRTADLLRLLPKGRRTVLDIGARDGHFARLMTEHFEKVTALDINIPRFHFPNVAPLAGDITCLPFQSDSFDCVLCAEVLEHVPDLPRACSEITRVARHEIVIGVPYRQDTRVGRTTCTRCGKPNPPWGHINQFTEQRLGDLFSHVKVVETSLVGVSPPDTNAVSALLMDIAGNPWGTYDQDEPCIHCGAVLTPTGGDSMWAKICGAVAVRLNDVQARLQTPHANWVHIVFSKSAV
jgi:SAM-dependent methyltransferase